MAADRLPRLRWAALLLGALAIAGAFVLAMEVALAMRGFHPTIVDSQAQWEKQRERARTLGHRALILVGDSRMQTDLDLAALRTRTGLEPVELAIDGSSFLPVLAGLARDADVDGTILVGFSDAEVVRPDASDASTRYEADFEHASRGAGLPDYHASEGWLADRLHAALASYADGARPSTSLLLRVLDPKARPQSVVTLPDRTRIVDYARADRRSLGLKSALFELDGNANAVSTGGYDDRERSLRRRIDSLVPADAAGYAARVATIESLTRSIRGHGGRVVFVALPTGGYVREIDARRYPRSLFWDRFATASSAPCVHFEDMAALRGFDPPDGLHLDGSDRRRFTEVLVEALGLATSPAARKSH
jgi:hypothetical protein